MKLDALGGACFSLPAGTRYRFFADLVDTDCLPDLPGVGSFFVQARQLDLPPGFRTTWKTRALVP